jgi:hypothetical protein
MLFLLLALGLAGCGGGGSGGGGNEGNEGSEGSEVGTGDCPLPEHPDESCTGVPAGTSLVTHTGDYTAQADETIDGMRITGDLFIDGHNVAVRNSEIHGQIKNPSMANSYSYTVQDSTIGPPSGTCSADSAFGHNNYTLERVRMRNFGEGPRVELGGNVVIRDSFFKLCDPGGDAHSDGIQGYLGGNDILIQHNTIDQRDVSIDRVTALIFWSDSSGDNVQFKDNLLAGGGYSIRIHAGSGHTVSGNRLVKDSWYYGPVTSSCGVISWSDNRLVEIDSGYEITSTLDEFDCAE